MNIFGVAQPTISGICTVLTLLDSHPGAKITKSSIWFCAREVLAFYSGTINLH